VRRISQKAIKQAKALWKITVLGCLRTAGIRSQNLFSG
jgi:hypothetical protein